MDNIEVYLKKRVYNQDILENFTNTEGYNLVVELLEKELENIVKEEDQAEGNKDFLTGKACGVKVFFNTVAKIIRYGEEAKDTLNK